MKTFKTLLTITMLCQAMPVAASKDPYSGSTPMLCAVAKVVVCSEAESCEEGLPEGANMPRFVIVDVPQQQVTGAWPPGTERVSKISRVQNLSDRLIIQGLDADVPWSATVDKGTGNVVAVHADRNLGFTIFGACMPK